MKKDYESALCHRGIAGTVEVDTETNILYGHLMAYLYTDGPIEYEGNTVSELRDNFHKAVDDYLATLPSHSLDNVRKKVISSLEYELQELKEALGIELPVVLDSVQAGLRMTQDFINRYLDEHEEKHDRSFK